MITCYYCDAPVTKFGEQDHHPVAERHGGTTVVPICIPCHDLKDRIPLTDWPIKMQEALLKAWPILPREIRILHAKLIDQVRDAAFAEFDRLFK